MNRPRASVLYTIHAVLICRTLARHAALCPAARAFPTTGSSSDSKTAINPTTVNNSASVNPLRVETLVICHLPTSADQTSTVEDVLEIRHIPFGDITPGAIVTFSAKREIIRAVEAVNVIVAAQAEDDIASQATDQQIVKLGPEDRIVSVAAVNRNPVIICRSVDVVIAFAAVNICVNIVAANPHVIIICAAVRLAAERLVQIDMVAARISAYRAVQI